MNFKIGTFCTQPKLLRITTFTNGDSNLEFDDIEALDTKFNLLTALSGQSLFKLPNALMRKKAVVNFNCENSCLLHALLSILHYWDLNNNHQRESKYDQWPGELNFGDVIASEVHIKRDVPKIEKPNNLKINVHVWEKEIQGCVYNDRKVSANKLLIFY